MAVSPGTTLGTYEIVSQLDAGGMGEAYKATDRRLNRAVAIKVLPPHFMHNQEMKQRFDPSTRRFRHSDRRRARQDAPERLNDTGGLS